MVAQHLDRRQPDRVNHGGSKSSILLLFLVLFSEYIFAAELPELVATIRPSIVGIGTHQALRTPPNILSGTGFAVGDGTLVVTNAHVVQASLNGKAREKRVAYVGRGKKPSIRSAEIIALDKTHDLALLRIQGPPVPALVLGDSDKVREGQAIFFTGFPIGAVLGLYPATHRGIVSVVSPVAIPQLTLRNATAEQIRRLRDPFEVFQLDATAYPGNSGSPVFDRQSGRVIGVINSVLVKESKENVLKDPSAISYAIPVKYVLDLLNK